MKRNESSVDRVIRALIGVACVVLALALGIGSIGGIVLLVVAAIAFVTAAVGFCPLYRLVGVSTCSVTPEQRA